MLAALLLAAAEPAAVPGLRPLVRQDCTADCTFEAVVKTGWFSPGASTPVLSRDGEAVCLLNPVVMVARTAGSGTPLTGVLTSVTLKRGGVERQVPVFLTFDVAVTAPVMVGQLCGATLTDDSFDDGWQAADPVRIAAGAPDSGGQSYGMAQDTAQAADRASEDRQSGLFDGLINSAGLLVGGGGSPSRGASGSGRATAKTGSANGYDSFSLRGAAASIGQAYDRLKKAVPASSALSPSEWLFKRDSAQTVQLLLRSVPRGARVLLGNRDIGLATETPIAVNRANFDAVELASGKVRRPIKACKVTPLTSAAADALVECDLKGQ